MILVAWVLEEGYSVLCMYEKLMFLPILWQGDGEQGATDDDTTTDSESDDDDSEDDDSGDGRVVTIPWNQLFALPWQYTLECIGLHCVYAIYTDLLHKCRYLLQYNAKIVTTVFDLNILYILRILCESYLFVIPSCSL